MLLLQFIRGDFDARACAQNGGRADPKGLALQPAYHRHQATGTPTAEIKRSLQKKPPPQLRAQPSWSQATDRASWDKESTPARARKKKLGEEVCMQIEESFSSPLCHISMHNMWEALPLQNRAYQPPKAGNGQTWPHCLPRQMAPTTIWVSSTSTKQTEKCKRSSLLHCLCMIHLMGIKELDKTMNEKMYSQIT